MSQRLISLSPDLQRLRDEGYDVVAREDVAFLLVRDVPYVNAGREVKRGVLVSSLTLAGEVTTAPGGHEVWFAGEIPCDSDGKPLDKIFNQTNPQLLAEGVPVDHMFSSKPHDGSGYPDYYAKMTAYANILEGQAQALDETATARTHPVIEDDDGEATFRYVDTASSRAEIGVISEKLRLGAVAIVGLGGTGSYVLDLVAKTPVREIHLYDADEFLQHNAFRSPGAPSVESLRVKPLKVDHFSEIYSNMHRGIVAHREFLCEENIESLRAMDFVFLCLDAGEAKRMAVAKLDEFGVRFIDVGMGIYRVGTTLAGIARVTTSTPQQRDTALTRIPFSNGNVDNDYSRNIQIADLNALNASLAVVKWKKLFGFYADLELEHNSSYTIDGNHLLNEDQPA
jgi:hypothetical protein